MNCDKKLSLLIGLFLISVIIHITTLYSITNTLEVVEYNNKSIESIHFILQHGWLEDNE